MAEEKQRKRELTSTDAFAAFEGFRGGTDADVGRRTASWTAPVIVSGLADRAARSEAFGRTADRSWWSRGAGASWPGAERLHKGANRLTWTRQGAGTTA